MDHEFVALMAVIRDAMMLLHVGESNNVCDAIWVEPYGSVPGEVTDKVCGCAAGLRRELHVAFGFAKMSHVDWLSRRYQLLGIPLFACEKMVLL